MSTSETITRTDLTNILNEVLPNPTMVKTVTYFDTQITWYSTTNPFCDVLTDITLDGWIPIDLTFTISGSLASFVYPTQLGFSKVGNTDYAHGYFRMVNQTPSTTTQNTVNWTVTYIKNAPMVAPMADYIVEQGTSGIWTYRKWNSGIAECWGTASLTPTWASYTAGLYFSAPQPTISYPFTITDAIVTANPNVVGSNVGWVANITPHTSNVELTIVRNGNTGNATVQLSVKGKWK